jgi:hypothetical protein
VAMRWKGLGDEGDVKTDVVDEFDKGVIQL